MKIAVIGSNSFTGSHFINYVLDNTDYQVFGTSRSPEKNPIFLPYKAKDCPRFTFLQMDLNHHVSDIIDLIKREGISKVINYAAQTMVDQSWDAPLHYYRTNALGAINLVEELRKLDNFQKYIQISTPEVYGSCENIKETFQYAPSDPYANSKATADIHMKLLNQQFGFPVDFVRATNVYGPGQQLFRIIPRSVIYIKLGKKIPLHGGGKAVKSFIHIRDACSGILAVLKDEGFGEVYHFSPDLFCSVGDIIRKICEKMGKDFNEAIDITEERRGQDPLYILDSSKSREKFNWKPRIGLNEGIEQCIDWVNKNWGVIKTLPLEYEHRE